ncbi:MAG: DUF4954 family protein, partial [Gemmatimonadaceae bacterium]|nr:DUF4954 family protein [Chitinophagaceae bacterium]
MNIITKSPIASLGYDFIPEQFIPKGKDEYHLRRQQNKSGIKYRSLTSAERDALIANLNTSDNWSKVMVSDIFNTDLVQNCKFFGLVRIGNLESFYLEFHNLRRPVGLYNSTIISTDLGNNIVIDNCNYLSHYILGNEVMIVNVNEVATTDHARFGNGILKDGESEKNRIKLEVCNENGGRSIIPFDGMLPGDAWLWTQFRDDTKLQDTFRDFTDQRFDTMRGYYGEIGDRTVIKNSRILKDVWIGTDAYIKGANKLKNLTVNSNANAKSQVGEGCELVNGIIGEGCRIFYGVKAVRFFMASHSQLKYGARLINSYLGNNATISCCEVLNSLIFPAHEQHHNNSFLCASLIMGQSNMAAGATIGSNHNSRSPDGELVAGRGFWPGLCVSLKHNSRFASFTIIAKGDYPAEIDMGFPFSLVANEESTNQLLVMPGYWFMYNMYALARNAWKYVDRDKRIDRTQSIEYDFLAPDSINEMLSSIETFKLLTGKAWFEKNGKLPDENEIAKKGADLLNSKHPELDNLEIIGKDIENSNRTVRLLKVPVCYNIFTELISYYAAVQLLDFIKRKGLKNKADLLAALPSNPKLLQWKNVGGQLIPVPEMDKVINGIKSGKVKGWDGLHRFYEKQGESYSDQKLEHALAALYKIEGINLKKENAQSLPSLLKKTLTTREWMVKGIFESREKDYENPFRKMLYENEDAMNAVIGKFSDNSFLKQEQ